jgi:predicted DsbA family dithiol-disulfide isomerase
VDIQIWSDVVCPWCYIGKRRLENALAEFGGDVAVTYRAFQLDAAPVPRPLPIRQVMAEKFGGPERADQMFAHVTAIAAADGLHLDFDRAIAANTFDAHRLIAWAAGQGLQAEMLDALQQAHFINGSDLGSRPALAEVAGSIGLDPSARFLSTDERMRAADRVWAVGDVTGNGAFTHMAMYEADIAVRDILGQGGPPADYHAKPRVTFTDPQAAAVQ